MSLFKENLILSVISLLVFLICISSIGFYFYKFSEISLVTSDWSNFATYFSAFISLANLMVFIYFSILVFDYNKKKDKQIEALDKPILAFVKYDSDKYKVTNIGRGPALNLRVKVIKNKIESSFGYICYSLKVNEDLELPNSNDTVKLFAEYMDVMGNKFLSHMNNDTMICVIQYGEKKQELSNADVIKEAQVEVRFNPIY